MLQRPEVKQALRGLGTARSFADALADLSEMAAEAGDSERGSNLSALVRLAHDYQAVDGQPSVAGFLAWLSDNTAEQPDVAGDAVEVATFHAAKGLEWPIVHLAGLEQGLVPISYARTRDALDEERRLIYVAITRAQQELRITWAKQRTFGERTAKREASLYLDDVEKACARLRDPSGATQNRPTRPPRRRPAEDVPAEGVLHALKQWRADKARAAAVPGLCDLPRPHARGRGRGPAAHPRAAVGLTRRRAGEGQPLRRRPPRSRRGQRIAACGSPSRNASPPRHPER